MLIQEHLLTLQYVRQHFWQILLRDLMLLKKTCFEIWDRLFLMRFVFWSIYFFLFYYFKWYDFHFFSVGPKLMNPAVLKFVFYFFWFDKYFLLVLEHWFEVSFFGMITLQFTLFISLVFFLLIFCHLLTRVFI